MNLNLVNVVAKYAAWIVIFSLLVDLLIVSAAGFVLIQAVGRVSVIHTDGLKCHAYAPTVGGTLYLVSRCKRANQ